MTDHSILRIGIASPEYMRERTIRVAKGEIKRKPDDPRVWFSSIESFANVLSTRNMLLLQIMRKSKPASLSELAKQSGRAKSNLSRTLHAMERVGLIELKQGKGGRKMPVPKYDANQIELHFEQELEAA